MTRALCGVRAFTPTVYGGGRRSLNITPIVPISDRWDTNAARPLSRTGLQCGLSAFGLVVCRGGDRAGGGV